MLDSLSSALASQERKWDWQVRYSDGAMAFEPVSVPLDEASKESKRIIVDLLALQKEMNKE